MKIFIFFAFAFSLVSSTVFAQRGQSSAQQQRAWSISQGSDDLIHLPVRNDSTGRILREVHEIVQDVIFPPRQRVMSIGFDSYQSPDEVMAGWARAFEALEMLVPFFTDPNFVQEEIIVDDVVTTETSVSETVTAVEIVKETPSFVPDALAKAYYYFWKGYLYNMMTLSSFLSKEQIQIYAQEAAENLTLFLQLRLSGSASIINPILINLYLNILDDPRNALTYIDENIVSSPRDAFLHIQRAQALYRVGRLRSACDALEQARAIDKNSVTPILSSSLGCP
jgi:hypothetical protein